MIVLRVLPPLGWTALIAWLATSDWSAPNTASWLLPILGALFPWAVPEQLDAIHWLARKAAHAGEYAVLAALWSWALREWRWAFGFAVATAVLDELYQATTLTREGSLADVLLDTAGAGGALGLLHGGRATLEHVTSALLWIAAAGGTAFLALHAAAGAPLGWLSLSAPMGWIALFLWRRRRAR